MAEEGGEDATAVALGKGIWMAATAREPLQVGRLVVASTRNARLVAEQLIDQLTGYAGGATLRDTRVELLVAVVLGASR